MCTSSSVAISRTVIWVPRFRSAKSSIAVSLSVRSVRFSAPPLCPHRTYAYVRAYGNICRGRVALLATRPPARPCSSPFASRRQGGEALPHPPDYRALIPRTVERRYPVLLRADTLGYPRALVRAAPRRRSLSASLATLSGHDAAPFR